MVKQIIKKISCPACNWVGIQTKDYGTESLLWYTCPQCNHPNLTYKPTNREKENEEYLERFERKKREEGYNEQKEVETNDD